MNKSLALLSGKGGSGKTTMALSMASLLSDCGVRVMLIDCDLSTNGATYFYENRLTECVGRLLSFDRVLRGELAEEDCLIEINDCFHFIPSITRIVKDAVERNIYSNKEGRFLFNNFLKQYACKYDIILFDCQAGYTDVLDIILPFADMALVVMEADAISSAAIRSLYLKIGELIKDKKIYQVFNKVTKEEYEIYSKLSGGTVFTNIETVMFDWKIRKAFSVAQIPDMQNTSANYGEQIYNICNILFKNKIIAEKISKYKLFIELNKNSERQKQVKEAIKMIEENHKTMRNRIKKGLYTTLFPLTLALMCTVFLTLINDRTFTNYLKQSNMHIFLFLTILVLMLSVWIIMLEQIKEKRYSYKELDIQSKLLDEMVNDEKQLKEKIEAYNGKESFIKEKE